MVVDHPFTTPVPVRFRDIDAFGHVNNAVHVSYLEEARVAYFEQVLSVDLGSVGTVVASLSVDYQRPIELDDELVVETKVSELGTTSLTLDHKLRVDSEVAATASVVVVLYTTTKWMHHGRFRRGGGRRLPVLRATIPSNTWSDCTKLLADCDRNESYVYN